MIATSQPERSAPQSLALPAKLDRGAAISFAEMLRSRRGAPVTLTGDSVQQLGAFGLQALLVAQAAWKADGVAFGLQGISENMARDLHTLGVDPTRFTEAEET
jgi:anti-anti-sigma regulatory factor